MEQSPLVMQLLPIVLIFVVFYFLLIRPQQQKMKAHRAMLAAIRRGDRIVTGGGILGQVVKVDQDDQITVEIAENVRVKVIRSTVSSVLAKPQPAKASKETPAGGEGAGGQSERKGLVDKLLPRK